MPLYANGHKVCIATGAPINNQDKTITANGTYTADTGYTGLGTVNVNVEGIVQPIANGLLSWLDAQYNFYGTHSTSTTVWTPLSGTNFWIDSGSPSWGANYLNTTYSGFYAKASGNSSQLVYFTDSMPGLTYEAVFKVPSALSADGYILCNLENGGMDIRVSAAGKVITYGYATDSGYIGLTGPTIPYNTMIYACATISSSTNLLRLFTSTTEQFVSTTVTKPKYVGGAMAIGYNPSASGSSQGSRFAGYVYSARVYNRALTDAEIQNNYSYDKRKYNL